MKYFTTNELKAGDRVEALHPMIAPNDGLDINIAEVGLITSAYTMPQESGIPLTGYRINFPKCTYHGVLTDIMFKKHTDSNVEDSSIVYKTRHGFGGLLRAGLKCVIVRSRGTGAGSALIRLIDTDPSRGGRTVFHGDINDLELC